MVEETRVNLDFKMNNEVLEKPEEFGTAEASEAPEESAGTASAAESKQVSEVDQSCDSSESEVSEGADSSYMAEINELKESKRDLQEKYVRLLADFDNYKKNTAKQRQDLLKYQGQALVTDLLAVFDNFEYALSTSQEQTSDGSFRQGIELIHKSFLDTLDKWGIRGESSVGDAFDPTKHNALSMVEDPDAQPGTVLKELKKAFYYKDRLLRPAEVIVVKEGE